MKIVLTENDLATIDNALRGSASWCRGLAEKASDTPEGKYLKIFATQTAERYEALIKRLDAATEIDVEI